MDSNSQLVCPRSGVFWLDLCETVATMEKDSHLVSVLLMFVVSELLVCQTVWLAGLCILGPCLCVEDRYHESRRSELLAFLDRICGVSESGWFLFLMWGIFTLGSALAPPFRGSFADCTQAFSPVPY